MTESGWLEEPRPPGARRWINAISKSVLFLKKDSKNTRFQIHTLAAARRVLLYFSFWALPQRRQCVDESLSRRLYRQAVNPILVDAYLERAAEMSQSETSLLRSYDTRRDVLRVVKPPDSFSVSFCTNVTRGHFIAYLARTLEAYGAVIIA